MGDAEDLVGTAECGHAGADGVGDLAADIGVDFVEDEQGDAVLCGEGAFDSEHHAGDFTGGAMRRRGLAGSPGLGAKRNSMVSQPEWAGFSNGRRVMANSDFLKPRSRSWAWMSRRGGERQWRGGG